MTPVLKRPSWNPTMSNRSGRLRDHLRHFKEGGFSGHNVIERENCSHQVLKFVTIKTASLLEELAIFSLPTADVWFSHF